MRGIFQRPLKSGVWWASYFVDGKHHREKVGRKSDAIDLYQTRKAEARAGKKLPALRNTRGTTIGELLDDALQYASDHKDIRTYKSRAEIVRAAMGHRSASSLTPQELDGWLKEQCKTPATANRYKALLSLCYQEGIRNSKVTVNVARLVRHRKEPQGRLRFLSRDEYDTLHAVIAKRFPEHVAEFEVSVYTGMRLTEQYSCQWSQFHPDRKTIELTKTKNGDARTVHLNSTALAAIESLRPAKVKPSSPIFPRQGTKGAFNTRSWFVPCLEEAKIEGYVWHGNRHTFCSWLSMAGASIREIQEAAGQKSITMAARYSHLSPQHKGSVVERIVT
jgi:integrase